MVGRRFVTDGLRQDAVSPTNLVVLEDFEGARESKEKFVEHGRWECVPMDTATNFPCTTSLVMHLKRAPTRPDGSTIQNLSKCCVTRQVALEFLSRRHRCRTHNSFRAWLRSALFRCPSEAHQENNLDKG